MGAIFGVAGFWLTYEIGYSSRGFYYAGWSFVLCSFCVVWALRLVSFIDAKLEDEREKLSFAIGFVIFFTLYMPANFLRESLVSSLLANGAEIVNGLVVRVFGEIWLRLGNGVPLQLRLRTVLWMNCQ
ncbi:MAG: hypothetical protein ACREV4_15485 [Gammaproteobacteria bacterium]